MSKMDDCYPSAQGWNGSSSGYAQEDGMGRYGRDSYDARFGMDRYGSGGLEQPHEPTDDEADEEEVSRVAYHPMGLLVLLGCHENIAQAA